MDVIMGCPLDVVSFQHVLVPPVVYALMIDILIRSLQSAPATSPYSSALLPQLRSVQEAFASIDHHISKEYAEWFRTKGTNENRDQVEIEEMCDDLAAHICEKIASSVLYGLQRS